jgi:STE24 endopeptidase
MATISAAVTGPKLAVRRGHYGAWRALTAAPAMMGSLFLLLFFFGWMGQWEGLLLLGWLASGLTVFTRRGERIAVRVGCGFRRPYPQQAEVLDPVWAAALARCGVAAGSMDLYVQYAAQTNAYSAGGRSVAVSAAVVQDFLARRLSSAEMEAVLVHELGHHATRATRFALVCVWLALPWRLAAGLVLGFAMGLKGRQPLSLLALVVAVCVVDAVVQAVQARAFLVAFVLASLAVCGVVCPLADAWIGRRSEYAADRFAVDCGVGPELIRVLRRLDSGVEPGWAQQLLNRHPSCQRRIAAVYRSNGWG